MYEEHFGLERPPFKITPDPSLFYEGGKRGDILAALVYTIHRGEGIIKVVGEVGSGKTMLCRMLQLKLPDTIEIVYIANPSVSPQDILFVIAHELSLAVTKDASKHEVVHRLHDYLLQRHSENKQVVLFIEEAQGMPLDTLEEIRLLSNLETDQNKLLQIVLFGQPELDQNLAQQSIRQLRERITHNFNLDPLDQHEIHSYLNFRMREVGYTGPELINKSVAKKVEQYSHGLLRRINIIADKILLSAFAEGTHNLNAKHVSAAVNDSEFDVEVKRKSQPFWWLAIPVVLALAVGLYQTHALWATTVIVETEPVFENTAKQEKPSADRAPPIAATERVGAVIEPVDTPIDADATRGASAEENQGLKAAAASSVQQQSEPALQPIETGPAQIDVDNQGGMIDGQTDVAAPLTPAVGNILRTPAFDAETSREAFTGAAASGFGFAVDYTLWLESKLQASRTWLSQADRDKVSIQVLMRSKSAARELVNYLRTEWPLDISQTYLYEVHTEKRSIYRVFYSEYDTVTDGKNQLELLPESIKVNAPYLNSVYRMQKALL